MRSDDSSSRGTWKYPLMASRLAKHQAVAGMDWRMSFVIGNGCTGRSMYLLSGEKSVPSLLLPFGFQTKNVWQHHGVGSVTLVMIP